MITKATHEELKARAVPRIASIRENLRLLEELLRNADGRWEPLLAGQARQCGGASGGGVSGSLQGCEDRCPLMGKPLRYPEAPFRGTAYVSGISFAARAAEVWR